MTDRYLDINNYPVLSAIANSQVGLSGLIRDFSVRIESEASKDPSLITVRALDSDNWVIETERYLPYGAEHKNKLDLLPFLAEETGRYNIAVNIVGMRSRAKKNDKVLESMRHMAAGFAHDEEMSLSFKLKATDDEYLRSLLGCIIYRTCVEHEAFEVGELQLLLENMEPIQFTRKVKTKTELDVEAFLRDFIEVYLISKTNYTTIPFGDIATLGETAQRIYNELNP